MFQFQPPITERIRKADASAYLSRQQGHVNTADVFSDLAIKCRNLADQLN